MSDQAFAWKAAFGTLVLVFSAASYWIRLSHDAQDVRDAHVAHMADAPAERAAAPIAPTAPPERHAPIATAAPVGSLSSEPAPLDVQEDAAPARVEIALHDTQPAPPPAQLTPRRTKTHAFAHRRSTASGGAARVHNVSLKRRNSPYAIGRKHYPYDPRELHAMRDAP